MPGCEWIQKSLEFDAYEWVLELELWSFLHTVRAQKAQVNMSEKKKSDDDIK